MLHDSYTNHNHPLHIPPSSSRLKVCDFGLVRVKATQAGTPAYMAPELLENRPFNKSVDVYAFGVLLNELFAGEIPFLGLDVPKIRERAVSGERPHVPTYKVPPRVIRLVSRCWHHSPSERPAFSEVVDELLEIYDTLPEGKQQELAHGAGGDALDELFK